ncbi:MAG: shikimate dehydrogenase [Alphaproteobacteria bacterium]|nr:shikimate dehydrogenase [Alphaproteobacteria bacterium]
MTDFKKAGVIGHPISHSKSPVIHNYWIQKYGLNGSYDAIDLSCENLEQGIRKLIEDGFTGFNVTVPHKISVLDVCDSVDNVANTIGAVNTIIVKGGKLHGTNTDAYGFLENLKKQTKIEDFGKIHPIILGAGGAAKSVLYALQNAGCKTVKITNRTQERAEALADGKNNVEVINWENKDKSLNDINLLINTTSLGMIGQKPLEIDLYASKSDLIVYDIVYNPLMTNLLQQAKKKNLKYVTGIGMLLYQAQPAFEQWFGIKPEVTKELEDLVL